MIYLPASPLSRVADLNLADRLPLEGASLQGPELGEAGLVPSQGASL